MLFFTSIFLLTLGCANLAPIGLDSNDVDNKEMIEKEKEITDFHHHFSLMEKKENPLWICDTSQGGVTWAIPKHLDCSLPVVPETSTVVDITIFWPDITHQEIKAFECRGQHTDRWISRSFWLNFPSFGGGTRDLNVTPDECWQMVRDHRTPDGESITLEKKGTFGTFKPTRLEGKWNKNVSLNMNNYFYSPVHLTVLDLDQSILTTLPLKEPCLYSQSFCYTERGIIVWAVEDVKICRMREGERTKCIYSNGSMGSRLICPDQEMSFHNITSVGQCGVRFGSSSQGILFLQNNPNEMIPRISFTKDVREIVTQPKARSKREVTYQAQNAQDSFINAKFNYLYEVVKKGFEQHRLDLERKVCKSNQLTLNMARFLAELGFPTLLTRYFLGDESYRAEFAGDVLLLFSCLPIYEYKFTKREKCTREWPVTFRYNGMEVDGFISPLSHTIVNTPTDLSEPCVQFYFDSGTAIFQLTNNGPKLVNIPVLPTPGEDHKQFKFFPDLTFKSGSGFDFSDLTNTAFIYSIFGQGQAPNYYSNPELAQGNETDNSNSIFGDLNIFSGLSWFNFDFFWEIFSYLRKFHKIPIYHHVFTLVTFYSIHLTLKT